MGQRKYVIDFDDPPTKGCGLRYFRGELIILKSVEPYTRKDGSQSFILTWVGEDGRIGTSGMKSASVNWGAA